MVGPVNEGKLRKIIQLFQDSDIDELEVQHSFWCGTRIRLSKGRAGTETPALALAREAAPAPTPQAPAAEPASTTEKADDGLREIPSPMVGTFYRATAPEAEPFVREGERVESGQTVCIIEAMKIMNEIPADISGEIVEFLVDNAQPVEYNQPLLKIRPS
jgi:acetyl-CoA carboxylase biotin carboxyl carrier protein